MPLACGLLVLGGGGRCAWAPCWGAGESDGDHILHARDVDVTHEEDGNLEMQQLTANMIEDSFLAWISPLWHRTTCRGSAI